MIVLLRMFKCVIMFLKITTILNIFMSHFFFMALFCLQKVLACRKKLMEYDRTELAASEGHIAETVREEPGTEALFSKCYGCCSATTEHCLVLLRALAVNPTSRSMFAKIGLVHELMENNLRRGMPQVMYLSIYIV